MARSYLTGAVPVRKTKQSEPIPGREQDMVENSAGGFTFTVDTFKQVERFLILGSEAGTYYASEQKLTKENATNLTKAIKQDGLRVVKMIRDISVGGRAPKNDQAIFALAVAASVGDQKTKEAALNSLVDVCRTGTHLFQFAEFIDTGKLRGWGRGLRTAVANWYLQRNGPSLVYQMAKYQQRNGWSHRDLLRLSHPKAGSRAPEYNSLFKWAITGNVNDLGLLKEGLLGAMDQAKTATSKQVVNLIRTYGLTREMIPTEHLNDVGVWEALLEKMPLTAMIRNLGKMSSIGLLAPLSDASKLVCKRLGDQEYIKHSRVHPVALFIAQRQYTAGHGLKGKLTWSSVPQVVDALDSAFYLGFANVPVTNKNFYLGIDVSGSMDGGVVAGVNGFTPRQAAALMAMVTARSEPNYYMAGFSNGTRATGVKGSTRTAWAGLYTPVMQELNISAKDKLDTVVRKMSQVPMGGTDCALPMLDALARKIKVDAFIVYTDNETWFGDIHPCQALRDYREKMGIPAKLIVQAFTPTPFTIADPNDAGTLDVIGMDSNVPAIISGFVGDGTTVSEVEQEPED